MPKLFLAAAAALFLLAPAGAGAAPLGAMPDAAAGPAVLVAKRLNTIPANCTMDPFKKVYSCCTLDSSGTPQCTEYPLDHKWPVMRLQQLQQFQTQPATKQPGLSQ